MSRKQAQYLRVWAGQNWARFVSPLLGWTLVAIVMEISLPLLVHRFLDDAITLLKTESLPVILALAVLGLGLFLGASFRSLMARKGLTVYLLNALRRDHVAAALNQKTTDLSTKGRLMAKITYHFSLLQMGLTQSLYSAVELLFLILGVLFVGFWLGPVYYYSGLLALPVYGLIGGLSHVISKHYVSRDQTLYSKMIRHISVITDEEFLTQSPATAKAQMQELERLVELDSYFRVRRDVWMKYGNAVLFAGMLFVASAVYVWELTAPFIPLEDYAQTMTYAVFLGVLIRGLYLAHRVGLFAFPAYIGAALSVPEHRENLRTGGPKWGDISFRTSHLGLRCGRSLNRVDWHFPAKTHVQITGLSDADEAHLIEVFSAKAGPSRGRQWMIKADKTRVSYGNWCRKSQPVLVLSDALNTDRSVVEVLLSRPRTTVHQRQISALLTRVEALAKAHPAADFILEAIIKKASARSLTPAQRILLNAVWAHLNAPSLVIVPAGVKPISPAVWALLKAGNWGLVSFAEAPNIAPDRIISPFSG